MFKTEGFGAIYSIVYSEWIIEWIFWKYSIISNFIFLRKNDWQKEGYPVYYVLCSARAQNNKKCASGSVGGARPCQGRGRGFESRLALFSCKGISDRISLFAWNEPWRAQNRIHRILFEVSEDIKSSSVGANHWSPRPIAPSRAPAQRNVVQIQVERTWDLVRDSGQRKLTYSSQNHCTSSRSVYLSRRLYSHWERSVIIHHLQKWESSRLK